MTVIARIAMKCPNSKSQFDPKWFELVLLSYLINLQWDDYYSNNCDEMSKFEVSIWSKMVWVSASVISYKLSVRWLLLGQFDEMSKYKSHFDLNWFELGLLSYLINLQWDDCYSDNCDEMSKYEVFCPTRTEYVSYISLSNFHLDQTWFRLQLQWY